MVTPFKSGCFTNNWEVFVNTLKNLKGELLKIIANLIKSLSEWLEQMNLALQKVASVAEGAMDFSLTQQEDIKKLQESGDKQAEQLVILNNRQHFFNLKYRWMAEKNWEHI